LGIIDQILCKQLTEFKRQKVEEFARVVRDMSSSEVENSNSCAEFWSNLLGSHPNLKLSGSE